MNIKERELRTARINFNINFLNIARDADLEMNAAIEWKLSSKKC